MNRPGFPRGSISWEDGVHGKKEDVLPEVQERAVRLVFDHAHQHDSQWAAIRSVAKKIGCTSEMLRHWVRQAERDTYRCLGVTTNERGPDEGAGA